MKLRRLTRRTLLVLLLFIVGGAIINVAVAWIFPNAFGEKSQVTRNYDDGTVEHVSFPQSLERGWPFSALASEIPAPGGGSTGSAIELSSTVELALWPIWPGFAINTIFYAGVLWLLFTAPGFVRRRIRIMRHRCPACGYLIGTSSVCTECGTALSAPRLSVE